MQYFPKFGGSPPDPDHRIRLQLQINLVPIRGELDREQSKGSRKGLQNYYLYNALKAYTYQVGSFPILSRYLVIPQYLSLKYRDKEFINTTHPYLYAKQFSCKQIDVVLYVPLKTKGQAGVITYVLCYTHYYHIVLQYYIQGSVRFGGFFYQKIPPTNQPIINFVTAWYHWLGIAKLHNVFRSTLNLCI